MLISTDEGAGQIVTSGEDTKFYDDIGCLAADWATHRPAATAFVRARSGIWIDAAAAAYAQPTATRTAMGSGLAAFTTTAEARVADATGRALTWGDVVAMAGAGQ